MARHAAYGFTAARTTAPTTRSARLTALVPLLSWFSEPMDTYCDLSVCPLESLARSLLESNGVPAFTIVSRIVTPFFSVDSVTTE